MKKSYVMLLCLVYVVFPFYLLGNEFERPRKRSRVSTDSLKENNAKACVANIAAAAEMIEKLAKLQQTMKTSLEATVESNTREYHEAKEVELAKITNQLCEMQICLDKVKNL